MCYTNKKLKKDQQTITLNCFNDLLQQNVGEKHCNKLLQRIIAVSKHRNVIKQTIAMK